MYEVSKCAPKEALRDLNKAIKGFFRGLKQSQKFGFPKFKKKSYLDSFRLTGTIKTQKNEIQLPRLGSIKLKENSKVEGKILSATVSRETDRLYISLTIEQHIAVPAPVEGEIIDVDVGLKHFAALSNKKKIGAPKPLEKKIKHFKRLSKQHSRKIKESKNRKKSALQLAQQHRKIRKTHQDFLHKTSTEPAKTKSVIIIEDLDIKSRLQGSYKLNRSIHDAGWGEFRRMLEYKTMWYGSKLMVAPRYYPSGKKCSHCDYLMSKMPLSLREWN